MRVPLLHTIYAESIGDTAGFRQGLLYTPCFLGMHGPQDKQYLYKTSIHSLPLIGGSFDPPYLTSQNL